MGRPKEVVDVHLAERAAAAIKEIPDHKVCLRLQAIASSASHPISLVSSIFGTSRQTLWRWIKRFAAEGARGLQDSSKGHRRAKLSLAQRLEVARWLEEGGDAKGQTVYWTLAKLASAIESEFGLKIGQTATWRLVQQLGFRQKVPRPSHAKADKQAQEVFKKKPAKR